MALMSALRDTCGAEASREGIENDAMDTPLLDNKELKSLQEDDTIVGFSGGTFASLGGFTRALASSFDMTILGARHDKLRQRKSHALSLFRRHLQSGGV